VAQLIVDLEKLRHNIHFVCTYCSSKNLELIGVIKGAYAFHEIIKEFQEGGIKTMGMSKASLVSRWTEYLIDKPILISLPSLNELDLVTCNFKASLISEIDVIKALAASAERNSQVHGIILMVDNGDLREGVMPEDVLEIAEAILSIKNRHLKFLGLGANLGCCSGTLPDHENISQLEELALDIETRLGYGIETVSIGGSVMLDWMEHNELPLKINQIRIGESILLGNIPSVNRKHPELFDDVFILRGDILEVKEKPSKPPGRQGKDAFGCEPRIVDRGRRIRALLNFGLVDTDPSGLIACAENIEVINYNADYTVVDLTECEQHFKPGDALEFKMNYRSMLQSFVSPFIRIEYV
jgi:predicted amino acid racemase